jgi:hypothetical protein
MSDKSTSWFTLAVIVCVVAVLRDTQFFRHWNRTAGMRTNDALTESVSASEQGGVTVVDAAGNPSTGARGNFAPGSQAADSTKTGRNGNEWKAAYRNALQRLMMPGGIILIIVGLLGAAFKGYVVWDMAHDSNGGGGAPTLDFPIFCPIPLAIGASFVATALGRVPFPGFGFVVYLGLAVVFGFLLWLFDRLGESERARQLQAIQQNRSLEK